ncbi:MAG: hypothetical protein JNM36_17350 [Chitinophagales bacterium]|nr:hypothetical protein [Chitinophagales bacterium]
MVSVIKHTSYVIDFLDVGFDTDQVSNILKPETNLLLSKITVDGLDDWQIIFNPVYNNGSQLRIGKKTKSYVMDKEKWITIHIPIPTKDIVTWGVDASQLLKTPDPPNAAKYLVYLPIDTTLFTNRFDYIVATLRQGILFSLQDGFMVNGKKIKLSPLT